MEFGKKVYVGNFIITKKSKSLSKEEMAALRSDAGINPDKYKGLSRHSYPYMHIENVGGGWELNIYMGMTMFDALDDLTVVPDDARGWVVPGNEGVNAEIIITGMFMDTTTVGDAEYQAAKLDAMRGFIARHVNGGDVEEVKDEKE